MSDNPQQSESFQESMERNGGYDEPRPESKTAKSWDDQASDNAQSSRSGAPSTDTSDDDSKEVSSEENKPSDETKAKSSASLKQVRDLAKELGLEFDGKQVVHPERRKFRDWKEWQVTQLEQKKQRMFTELRAAKENIEAENGRTGRIMAALRSGDADDLAQALGKKDWNEVQEEFIAKNSDPNYKKMRELEAWKQQQDEREENERAEFMENRRRSARNAARERYREALAKDLAGSKSPTLRVLAEDPQFVSAIFAIQEDHWDGHSTVTPEQALKMAATGDGVALIQRVRDMRRRLNKAFAHEDAPKVAESEPKRRAPSRAFVPTHSPSGTSALSPRARYERERVARETQWNKHFRDELGRAADREFFDNQRARRRTERERGGL